MKKNSILILAILVTIIVASNGWGATIQIDSDIHHLGDNILNDWGLFSLSPEPEGATWVSNPFDLTGQATGIATIILDCVNTEGSFVLVNGNVLGEIPFYTDADIWHSDQELEFDSSFLNQTNNLIQIESSYDVGNDNYDDFLFQNVRLEYITEPPCGVDMEWVSVGDAGNTADDTGYGAVSYEYRIGKYEVTNSQYCEFLNAVAGTDTHGLYNTSMAAAYGGIERSGSAGSYSYFVKSGRGKWPVNYVSWYDTIRFANWMHNGKPNGPQDDFSTEDGAYDMDGDLTTHRTDAEFWVPTENEWHKTAYYKAGGTNAGYWVYATQSDSPPNNNWPENDTGNSANWAHLYSPPYLTDADAYELSASAYGTLNQNGSLWEWTETLIGSTRMALGGAWAYDYAGNLAAYNHTGNTPPAEEWKYLGFRVASVTEPPCTVDVEWVTISDPGFTGQMSKYETTNAQYCQFLNEALASGDITLSGNDAIGASGSNSGTDYVGQLYYDTDHLGVDYDGAINGGAARITFNGNTFSIAESRFENHPVTFVSWYGAAAFCNYYGYRLPTEWEWQAVADYDGSYIYGCGLTINKSINNYYGSTHPDGTTEVGQFGIFGHGMADMAGNALEWTSSLWNPASNDRVVRGGGWSSIAYGCDVSYRYYNNPTPGQTIGFRVARSADPATEPDIALSPESYDFGDVEIESSTTTIVTITNEGDADLTVSGISIVDGTDFAITSAPAVPLVVPPGSTVDVEITFTPSQASYLADVLQISSDDPDEAFVEVQLGGIGVKIETPPDEKIQEVLDLIDTSVSEGTLQGEGSGNSADKKLNAFINMIEAAGDLIDDGLYEEAYQQLQDLYRKCDGQSPPPDFISGDAAVELAELIHALMDGISFGGNDGVYFKDDMEDISALWTFGEFGFEPSDVIKFAGSAADEFRALENGGHYITLALFAGLQLDGILSSFLTSEGSLEQFYLNLAGTPEEALATAIGGDALNLAIPLVQLLQTYSVGNVIATSTGDVYIIMPEYPEYELPTETGKLFSKGRIFASDDLTQETLTNLNPLAVAYYESLDEKAINPNGYSLGKANWDLLQEEYVPVPNNYEWKFTLLGEWRWVEPQ